MTACLPAGRRYIVTVALETDLNLGQGDEVQIITPACQSGGATVLTAPLDLAAPADTAVPSMVTFRSQRSVGARSNPTFPMNDDPLYQVGYAIGIAVDVTSGASVAQGTATHDAVMPIVRQLVNALAEARDRANLFEGFVERLETQHITWTGPDGAETHPDWCRECRVDQARDAARVEIDRREAEWTEERHRYTKTVAWLDERLAAANMQLEAVLRICNDRDRPGVGEGGLGYSMAQDDIRRAIDRAVPVHDPAHREAARQLLAEHGWGTEEAEVIAAAMAPFVARRLAAGKSGLPSPNAPQPIRPAARPSRAVFVPEDAEEQLQDVLERRADGIVDWITPEMDWQYAAVTVLELVQSWGIDAGPQVTHHSNDGVSGTIIGPRTFAATDRTPAPSPDDPT